MAHDMAGYASCTGETLTCSPSTNPTLADDSTTASIMGKDKEQPYGKDPVGGNATGTAPAAPCVKEDRSLRKKAPRPSSSKRPLFSSSSEDEKDQWEDRGKGKGRLTRSPSSKPRVRSRISSPSTHAEATAPHEPKGGSSGDDTTSVKTTPVIRERSPKRSGSRGPRNSDGKPRRSREGRAGTPVRVEIFTPVKRSPRQESRAPTPDGSTVTPSPAVPIMGKFTFSPRPASKGVADTPSSSCVTWHPPGVDDAGKTRLAEASEGDS